MINVRSRCISKKEPSYVVVHAEPGVHKVVSHSWLQSAIPWGGPRLGFLGAFPARRRRAQQKGGDNTTEVGDVELGRLFAITGASEGGGQMLLQRHHNV